ncbi:MAG: hypothetical protein IE935_13740 [Micrococcales bacterium]|nr:hypothetical protein [Micrococcales bacterium]
MGAASTGSVLDEVARERARQDAKWGEQNHPDGSGPRVSLMSPILGAPSDKWGDRVGVHLALMRELRDNAVATTDQRAVTGELTWRDILLEEVFEAFAEEDPARLRAELIQVAAVATQWVEAIDRRSK